MNKYENMTDAELRDLAGVPIPYIGEDRQPERLNPETSKEDAIV